MAEGNRHLGYKEALNAIEDTSPGTKAAFYFGFLERASHHFTPEAESEKAQLGECSSCGAATPGAVCAFCKLRVRASAAT